MIERDAAIRRRAMPIAIAASGSGLALTLAVLIREEFDGVLVTIAIDAYLTYLVFWIPQSSSTGGIAAVLGTLVLVVILIPAALIVGLLLTPADASAPRAPPTRN